MGHRSQILWKNNWNDQKKWTLNTIKTCERRHVFPEHNFRNYEKKNGMFCGPNARNQHIWCVNIAQTNTEEWRIFKEIFKANRMLRRHMEYVAWFRGKKSGLKQFRNGFILWCDLFFMICRISFSSCQSVWPASLMQLVNRLIELKKQLL